MKSGMAEGEATAQRHPLAAVRAARGWSYQDLVEAVASQSRSLGVPMAARREKAWRWENWGVVPDADSQRALALALGVAPGRVGGRPWPSWLPTGAELPVDLAWSAEGAVAALRDLVLDVEEDRRGFAIAGPGVLADALGVWCAGVESGGVGRTPRPRPVQHRPGVEDDVRAWLRAHTLTLSPLVRATVSTDSLVLRQRLNADLRLIAELAGAVEDGSELFRAAARIALIAGRRCVRDGLHGPAQRYLFTALRCAWSAGDGRLGGLVLGVVGRHLAGVGDAVMAGRFRSLGSAISAGAGRGRSACPKVAV